MPLTKAPVAFPFTSAAVIEMFAAGGGEGKPKFVGTVFLVRTEAHNRRDIVLGAGHNLSHLSDANAEVHVTVYGGRDVNSIAVKANGSYKYAIAGTKDRDDYGVAVLAEALSETTPIPLTAPEDKTTVSATAAGGRAEQVAVGDRAIYQNTADFHASGTVLYCDPGVTAPGMCGGPVLYPSASPASAIGLVQGTGTITPPGGQAKPVDLAIPMTAAIVERINGLIDAVLA